MAYGLRLKRVGFPQRCLFAVALAALAARAGGETSPLSPEGSLCLSLQPVQARQGEREAWRLVDVQALSDTRWLALLERSVMVPDSWENVEEKEKRAQAEAGVVDVKLKRHEEGLYLALLSKDGKVVKMSTALPVERGEKRSTLWDFQREYLIFADEAWDTCPYAFLALASWPPALRCFDFQLSAKETVSLPSGRIAGGIFRTSADGNKTLWVFSLSPGEGSAQATKQKQNQSGPTLEATAIAMGPEADRKPKIRQLNLGTVHLASARDETGSPLVLFPETLQVAPFSTAAPQESVPFLAVAKAAPSRANNVTERLVFFRGAWTRNELSRFQQLPVWVVFEARADADVDTDRGVVRLPMGSGLANAQAFPRGPKGTALYLLLNVNDEPQQPSQSSPPADTTNGPAREAKSFGALQLLITFTEKSLDEIVLLEDIFFNEATFAASSLSDVRVVPLLVMGPAREGLLAVRASARSRTTKAPAGPCAALFRLPR